MSNPERGDATAPSTLSGHKRLFIAPARSGDSRRCVVRLTSAPPPAKRPLWTTGVRDAALARSPLRRPVVLAARSLARVRNACSIDLAGHLARRRDEVIPQSHATATLASYASADRSFLEFCEVLGLDFDSFGLPLADGGYAVWEEDEILGLWLIPYLSAVAKTRVAKAWPMSPPRQCLSFSVGSVTVSSCGTSDAQGDQLWRLMIFDLFSAG